MKFLDNFFARGEQFSREEAEGPEHEGLAPGMSSFVFRLRRRSICERLREIPCLSKIVRRIRMSEAEFSRARAGSARGSPNRRRLRSLCSANFREKKGVSQPCWDCNTP
jgi:hypothetical protein